MDEESAVSYLETDAWRAGADAAPVLIRLVVHSALVIPAPNERSADLSRATYPHLFIRGAVPQLVVPPDHSTWKVDELRVGPFIYAAITQI